MITTVGLQVHGMTCLMCQTAIEESLIALDGIKKVEVSYVFGKASVVFDSKDINITEIYDVITNLGYEVSSHQVFEDENNRDQEKKTNQEKKTKYFDMAGIWFYGKSLAIIGSLAILYDRFIGFENLVLVRQDMGLGMVFVIGLITSIHCVTMCGGIGLSISMKANAGSSWLKRMEPNLRYQMGRVVSYTMIGALVGGLGSIISLSASMKSIPTLIAGIFMIAMALRMMGVANVLTGVLYRLLPRLPKKASNWLSKKKRGRAPFVVGLLNGLMPCGPLQAMQLYALQTGSMFMGALSMFLFSIGTIPLMIAVGAMGSLRNNDISHKLYRLGAMIVLILGFSMTNRVLLLQGVDVLGNIEQRLGMQNKESIMAKIEDNRQVVLVDLQPSSYPKITAQADMPVILRIEVREENLNGCNNEIVIPALGIRVPLHVGVNEIELPSMTAGNYVYTCWMGMITGQITIL